MLLTQKFYRIDFSVLFNTYYILFDTIKTKGRKTQGAHLAKRGWDSGVRMRK